MARIRLLCGLGILLLAIFSTAGRAQHPFALVDSNRAACPKPEAKISASSPPETMAPATGSAPTASLPDAAVPQANPPSPNGSDGIVAAFLGEAGAGATRDGPPAWGIVGLRGFAFSQLSHQVAPNGLDFNALFAADFNFNLWLWRDQGVYLFSDSTFWGQRAAPGITNPTQGSFDFSKREFDLSVGFAWNYYGRLEARGFAYSFNNLNRGTSEARPAGYADGVGLENRYYIGPEYANLGTADFDVARASFVSAGYFPTKTMVNAEGQGFKPGPFVRAYLTLDLFCPNYYLYADAQVIASRTFYPELLKGDFGVAARPFSAVPRLEFRLGSNNLYDPRGRELETGVYGQFRYLF